MVLEDSKISSNIYEYQHLTYEIMTVNCKGAWWRDCRISGLCRKRHFFSSVFDDLCIMSSIWKNVNSQVGKPMCKCPYGP